MIDQHPGVARAIQTIGGQVAVAAIFPDRLAQSTISEWLNRKRPVPPERAALIERETRRIAAERGDPGLIVTGEDLNSAFPWDALHRRQAPLPAAEPAKAEG